MEEEEEPLFWTHIVASNQSSSHFVQPLPQHQRRAPSRQRKCSRSSFRARHQKGELLVRKKKCKPSRELRSSTSRPTSSAHRALSFRSPGFECPAENVTDEKKARHAPLRGSEWRVARAWPHRLGDGRLENQSPVRGACASTESAPPEPRALVPCCSTTDFSTVQAGKALRMNKVDFRISPLTPNRENLAFGIRHSRFTSG